MEAKETLRLKITQILRPFLWTHLESKVDEIMELIGPVEQSKENNYGSDCLSIALKTARECSPVEQKQPAKTAEEILNQYGCPPIPFDENITMYYPAIIEAMHEFRNQGIEMPSEEIRKLLIEFNAFMNENEFDGRIPLIKDCIDEFLKSRMK